MFDLSREMNRQRDDGRSIAAAQDCLRHLGAILGLTFQEREASLNVNTASYNAMLHDLRTKIAETGESELAELVPDSDTETVSAPEIDRLIDIRTTCRSYKQYALADEIRGWLESQSISVEDSAAGSIWEYRPTS